MTNHITHQSRNIPRIILISAAVIGLLDSMYLSYVKLANQEIYCTPGLGNCDVVNNSRWSTLWGIPIAIFGVLMFATVIVLARLGGKIKFFQQNLWIILFGISLGGFLFSLYLTYIELFVLHTVCQWCILSALAITTIFITSVFTLVKKTPDY